MHALCVVAARPNFMKVAPVHAALTAAGHRADLVHTGQHYDPAMSQVFFEQLNMPQPRLNLEVRSGSHAAQTAAVMQRFEPVLADARPDIVLVAGDVNSTLACGLVAAKMHVPVAHLEAGLRSFDRRMPEEVNRVLVDHLSDVLLTPSKDADLNLRREGIDPRKVVRVGNAMIDSLRAHLPQARDAARALLPRLEIAPRGFVLVTLHRPSNVDDATTLTAWSKAFATLAKQVPVVWPVHPRTRAALERVGRPADVRLLDPLGYLPFVGLQEAARLILTDSGGVQEESTALGVPCLTLRDSTERPITVSCGTNTVVGACPPVALGRALEALGQARPAPRLPALWDGATAPRVVEALERSVGARHA